MQDKNFNVQLLKGDFHETKETSGGASFKCRHGFFRSITGAPGLDGLDGQHLTFSIDAASAWWPSDTSLPLGQPGTQDVHVLD